MEEAQVSLELVLSVDHGDQAARQSGRDGGRDDEVGVAGQRDDPAIEAPEVPRVVGYDGRQGHELGQDARHDVGELLRVLHNPLVRVVEGSRPGPASLVLRAP